LNSQVLFLILFEILLLIVIELEKKAKTVFLAENVIMLLFPYFGVWKTKTSFFRETAFGFLTVISKISKAFT
jgi:hypothetical protein